MKNAINRNDLPAEIKITIVQGQTLVDETRARMKKKGTYIDMTCKMQLKSDCDDVERYIKKFFQGKETERSANELELAIVRLQTSVNGILH